MKKLNPFLAILFVLILLSNCKKEEVIPASLDFKSFSDELFQNFDDRVNSIQRICKTPDGGFMLLGSADDNQFALIRLSAQGDFSWQEFYGNLFLPSNRPTPKQIIPASDGGYLIGGFIINGSQDAYLKKIGEEGYEEWSSSFGGNDSQRIEDLKALEDGSYLFCGTASSSNLLNDDLYFGRVDEEGDPIWTVSEDRNVKDSGNDLLQINAEEFLLLSASSAPPNNFDQEPVLSKYLLDGTLVWTQSYGSSGYHSLDNLKLLPAHDGGFLILSTKLIEFNNRSADLFLIKVDDNGVKEWEKNYGGTQSEDAFSMVATSDNAYVLLGLTRSFGNGDNDIYLLKVDAQGEEQWVRTYGSEQAEFAYDLKEKEDGGFVIGGFQVLGESPFVTQMISLQVNAQGIPQ